MGKELMNSVSYAISIVHQSVNIMLKWTPKHRMFSHETFLLVILHYTINSFSYQNSEEGRYNLRFQQEGSTVHNPRVSMTVQCLIFSENHFALRCCLIAPLLSPNMTSCDTFLWRYLEVNEEKPRTIDSLKNAICQRITFTG